MVNYSRKYKRINKTAAKKLYDNGGEIYFIPCKLDPDNNFYCLGIWESKFLNGQYADFEKLCNYFTSYNCNNETGLYIAFYIR
ncbi:MAG: hypothetical protein MJ232_08670 [archaeon]|nr:hypothetical protein [archaeon]